MSKPKTIKLNRNGKKKTFVEVKMENGQLVSVGKPFIVHGAMQCIENELELVVEEVKIGE